MRLIYFCFIIVSFIYQDVKAKNYYFSSSLGNDDYSIDQAQNPSTPWKTIDKLNQSIDLIRPGDSILFKRGDIFQGHITLSCSGTKGNKVVLTAYGDGIDPIIGGDKIITDWIETENNLWKAKVSQSELFISSLFIDRASQQIGRFPNSDEISKGYLPIESHNGDTQIKCSKLLGMHDWTGGEAVIRTRNWIIDRIPIELHSGSEIFLKSPTRMQIVDQFGFFIQDHLLTLDRDGEWFYDDENDELYLFYSENPNLHEISISAHENCIQAHSIKDIDISFLQFRGCIESGLSFDYCDRIEIKNCFFYNIGHSAVSFEECDFLTISYNMFSSINNNGIVLLRCNSIIVDHNRFGNIGMRPGMAPNTPFQSTAIYLNGRNVQCINNELDSIGYIGINFHGDSVLIENNVINYYCNILSDGGGIYTSGDEKIVNSNRIVKQNIVLNGIGAPDGTPQVSDSLELAHGIYMDARTNNVSIVGNTVAHCAGFGFYIHNSNHVSIISNTIFDNYYQIAFIYDLSFPNSKIRNCFVRNNIFFSTENSPFIIDLRTVDNDISEFGSFDDNYYCNPLPGDEVFLLEYTEDSNRISETLTLSQWQERFGVDVNSSEYPFKFPAYIVSEYLEPNEIFNSYFHNDLLDWTCWSTNNNCDLSWDTSKLDDGCLMLRSIDLVDGPGNSVKLYGSYGETKTEEFYVLKFSILSSNPQNREVSIVMRDRSAPYLNISPYHKVPVSNNRAEFELVFTPNISTSVSNIDFEFEQDATQYWLDNVELYKAIVDKVRVEDSILFLYNASQEEVKFDSDGYYIDARGNKFHNQSVLPFSSVLLKIVDEGYYWDHDFGSKDISLLIYPNPSKSILNVLTNSNVEKRVLIFDISGRLLYENDSVYDAFFNINIENYPRGIYLIKLIEDKGQASSSFIVM